MEKLNTDSQQLGQAIYDASAAEGGADSREADGTEGGDDVVDAEVVDDAGTDQENK